MMKDSASISIHFDPLVPDLWLYAAVAAALLLFTGELLQKRKPGLFRLLTVAAFIGALLNPSVLKEQRESVPDVAALVVDQSPSQNFGLRTKRTQSALSYFKEKLSDRDSLELRIVEGNTDPLADETSLFDRLEKTMADVPENRRAGVLVISDGQIHDIPETLEKYNTHGPIHLLLSGEKDERDRRIVIENAPAYGIAGDEVTVRFRIEDTDNIGARDALVTLDIFGENPVQSIVQTGKAQTVTLPVSHAGQNIFQLRVNEVEDEITLANNSAAIVVSGVRDRLRVLLVSGRPHAGGRMWRDLLTSDPGVDLIHFTILREPEKLDATPRDELALIAFPFQELFEVKLHDFDLIIFDRYKLNRILPDYYFDNIARFVHEGGALLEASGPGFAGEDSVYLTPLMNVLPAAPTGEIFKTPFIPHLSRAGNLHPVTHGIFETGAPPPGPWLRQVGIQPDRGDILMEGLNDAPLLILDRVDEGRVAQITSDHLWLWANGYKGGGPYQELLRRIVHWLMKEPELDEKALDIQTDGRTITIASRNFSRDTMNVEITKPDGTMQNITLEKNEDGSLRASVEADQIGVYGFKDDTGQQRYAAIGSMNPRELADVKTSPQKLSAWIKASGGGVFWLAQTPQPDIRNFRTRKPYAGSGWLSLRGNQAYNVTGLQSRPLLPAWLSCLLLFGLITLTWWREGRN